MAFLRKYSRICMLAYCMGLFGFIGGNWALLQCVAWTKMLWDYSHTSQSVSSQSIKKAVTRTFDGKHPCSLCKRIVKGKAKEKETTKTVQINFEVRHFPKPVMVQLTALVPREGSPIAMNRKHGQQILRMHPPTPPPESA